MTWRAQIFSELVRLLDLTAGDAARTTCHRQHPLTEHLVRCPEQEAAVHPSRVGHHYLTHVAEQAFESGQFLMGHIMDGVTTILPPDCPVVNPRTYKTSRPHECTVAYCLQPCQ